MRTSRKLYKEWRQTTTYPRQRWVKMHFPRSEMRIDPRNQQKHTRNTTKTSQKGAGAQRNQHITAASGSDGSFQHPHHCHQLLSIRDRLSQNFKTQIVAAHRSSTESNAQRLKGEPLGPEFAAQGRTEISLHRATLDSASAARSRCNSDHGDGRLRPTPLIPTLQDGQIDPKTQPSKKRIHNEAAGERGKAPTQNAQKRRHAIHI